MKIIFTERHLYLLRKILQDDWSYLELREFFEFVKSIAIIYLRTCEKNNLRISGPFETLDDIADDFMIDLFSRNKNGFKIWQRYIEQNGFPDLDTAKNFFYAIIKKRCRYGLDRLFYERDRQGWNNHKTFMRVADSCNFTVKRYGSNKFIIHKNDIKKSITPESDFAKIYDLYLRCANAPNLNSIAEKMLESIEESPVYARVIRLGVLNKAIKFERTNAAANSSGVSIYKRNGRPCEQYIEHDENDNDFHIRKDIYKTIDNYCQPYRPQYYKLAPAMKEYFDSILDGTDKSMYECYCNHFAKISNKEFRRTAERKLNYLNKIVKRRLQRYFLGMIV